MTIAIHITRGLHLFAEAFNASFAIELAHQCSGHKFIFLCDEEFESLKILPSNCSIVKLPQPPQNKTTLWILYRFRIPAILKKCQADFFISAGNICSMKTNVAQLLILHDKETLNPRFSRYLQGRQAAAENKAMKIFASGNINSAVGGNKSILPLHPDPKILESTILLTDRKKDEEADQEHYDYFFFVSSSTNENEYMTMLKAFSVFKKWQKSSLRLIICPTHEKFSGLPSLESYKYREDVRILPPAPAGFYDKNLSRSYAVIAFSGYPATNAGLQSLKSGIPFITLDEEGNRRFFEESCLYVKGNEADLGQKMILVYKNEDLRKELILKGKDHAARFSDVQCAREIAAAVSAYN